MTVTAHPGLPHQPWLRLQACQEIWWAGQDPGGVGRWFQARRDSALYARRARQVRVLADVEPITKAELMRHFDDWATDRSIALAAAERRLAQADAVGDAWLGRYLPWTSSGTSGQPGIFVQDAASLTAYDVIEAVRLRADTALSWWSPWAVAAMQPIALRDAGRRFAYVGSIGGPYAGHVSLRHLMRRLPPLRAPQVSLLSVLQPILALAGQLQALQPQVLITYPSCTTALAACQLAGTLGLQLDELWLGGEQLSAGQRHTLQAAFGCRVRNSYGASECYSIAVECAQGQLHLNSDWVILEGLDAPCACGNRLPVIEVQGRADVVLVLPARDGGSATVQPLALPLETVQEEQAQADQFQLLLQRDGALELRLPHLDGQGGASGDSSGAAACGRCRHVLAAWFEGQGLKPVPLVHGQAPPQMQVGSGKLRCVIDLRAAGRSRQAH